MVARIALLTAEMIEISTIKTTECNRAPILHWFVIGILIFFYVASYAFVAAIPDTNRDMYIAQSIASGTFFPLEGPILGRAIHLGPVWYYLLAMPIALTSSWVAACIFVGIIASLKFPLAYLCGRRLLNSEFGLAWAALLAMPGWNAYERLTVFNPNLASTVVLAIIWLVASFRSRLATAKISLAQGLVIGIGIHIHPTVAIVGLLPVFLILSGHWQWGIKVRALLVFCIGVIIPFVPYAISQLSTGMLDAHSSHSYIRESIAWANMLRIPIFLWGYLIVGPYIALRYVAALSDTYTIAASGLIFIMYLLAIMGIVKQTMANPRNRPLLLTIILCLLIACSWVLVLRPNTPAYFTYMLSPLFCGIFAFGLSQFRQPYARQVLFSICFFAIAFSILISLSIANTMQSGVGALPSLFEVKQSKPSDLYIDAWFPAHAHGELGKFLCSLTANTSLHGPLASIADWNVNVDSLLFCGRPTMAHLGGNDSHRAITGMPIAFWRHYGIEPDCKIGSLGLSYSGKPLISSKESIALGHRYLPREFVRDDLKQRVFTFDLPRNNAVLITNYLFPYRQMRIEEVRVDGAKIEAVSQTEMSRLYRNAGTVVPVNKWQISLAIASTAGVDIVAIPEKPSMNIFPLKNCSP